MIILGAPTPVVPGVLVALFVIGTFCGFLVVRRAVMARPRMITQADGHASAADEARTALSALHGDDASVVYAGVDTILRAYLDARFGGRTAALPGAEIERVLTRAGVTRSASRLTAHLLERCALMGAEATRPAADRIDADVWCAREIIDLTS